MKIELEILARDLEDRNVIIEMRASLEAKISKLSEYAKNNMINEINRLRGNIEWLENKWVQEQNKRAVNLLSQSLNVGRSDLGDREWHDD